MSIFSDIYRGKRVLLTGHTGFKGTWLTAWLNILGAEVTGIALPPATTPSHWNLLKPRAHDLNIDIRDAGSIQNALQRAAPDIVFHLAAQPLVRKSYADPLETFSTNVMGTASVLDACRAVTSLRAIVVVTTDKCYENMEWQRGYREEDHLGGHDPYSASKAAAEIVAASYRKSFFSTEGAPLLATARAGNVIGGGDWSQDRLIPDMVRAVAAQTSLLIRSPRATRPWQHVLEPLAGYLLLGQRLLQGDAPAARAWNFGPDDSGNRTVEDILNMFQQRWPRVQWQKDILPQPHEAQLLHLDSTRARTQLGWQPVWDIHDTVAMTANWYRSYLEDERIDTIAQIDAYMQRAASERAAWMAA